jgi:hypothetical protein
MIKFYKNDDFITYLMCVCIIIISLDSFIRFNRYSSKINSLKQEICYKSQESYKYEFCGNYDK